METLRRYYLLLLPLVFLELGLLAAALVDLLRREPRQVVGGKRWVWGIVIVCVNFFGPIVYFAFGRKD